jgi:hypothetical protein
MPHKACCILYAIPHEYSPGEEFIGNSARSQPNKTKAMSCTPQFWHATHKEERYISTWNLL